MERSNERQFSKRCFRKMVILCMMLLLVIPVQAAGAEKESGDAVNIIFDIGKNTEIMVYETPNGSGKARELKDKQFIFENAEVGDVFSYKASAPGCYTVTAAVAIGEEDVAKETKLVTVHLQQRTGGDYEPEQIFRWSDEIENTLFAVKDLQDVDPGVLDTPAFTAGRQGHKFTTQKESIAYLQSLNQQNEKAYLYFLDEKKSWPVMIFTEVDLTHYEDLEGALQALAREDHLKVMYQAQIHGNEPAAGEAALAAAKPLAQGKTDLQNMDVIVIPFANQYGAKGFTRYGNNRKLNLNRDGLQLQSAVTEKLHWLYGKLMPEIFIDGHEFSGKTAFVGNEKGRYFLKCLDDIQITCVNNLNRDSGIFPEEEAMMRNTIGQLQKKGFRAFFYDLSCDNTTSCSYARLRNSLAFLVESNGIHLGKQHFDRRVLSHREAVLSILRQAAEDADSIRRKVEDARAAMVQKGKNYSAADKFVLSHDSSGRDGLTVLRPSFDFLGEYVGDPEKTDISYNIDISVKSRTRPTAYIIPKDAEGAKKAAQVLKNNGAACFELQDGTKVPVNQYRGTSTQAVTGAAKKVLFKEGAYVFYMDQEPANIISASLEPDVADTQESKGSFVQAGLLKKQRSGGYPIYRCKIADPQENLKLKILFSPTDKSARKSGKVSFSVKAKGGNLRYQWYYKGKNSKSWKKSGAASAAKSTLILHNTMKRRGYRYRCVVSNGLIEVYSGEARLK